jgi:hypothetical protein
MAGEGRYLLSHFCLYSFHLHFPWEKEKRTPKENVDGKCTSSYDNKKFRTRSMEKQGGMAFGFRKTATAVKNTG